MLSALVFTALSAAAGANALANPTNNVTGIQGTWSSGSGAVSTGGNFCTPSQNKFSFPVNTGISYSFTDDGFFEEAQYRYDSNGTNPHCIRGKIMWQHGTYQMLDNGSLTLSPFSTDGRIQVQDPCAQTTNLITYYDNPALFLQWNTVVSADGAYTLLLNAFDGQKLPPLTLIANPPNMLPTQVLTGTNQTGQTVTRKRDVTHSLFSRTGDMFKRWF